MPLYGASTLLGNLQTFRILHIASRYGSGKTALAFRLAYELASRGAVRYICSNCRSPWCDDFGAVRLVNGNADVCLILDEAGMFMESKRKALRYIQFLRKLNIILIMPSAISPSSYVSFLRVKRTHNLQVFGLPAWVYRSRLYDADEVQYERFFWVNPAEIYGCYDTAGFPSDDRGAEDWLIKWTKEAAQSRGYEYDPSRFAGAWRGDTQTAASLGANLLEELRGVSEALETSEESERDAVSLLLNSDKKRGN